MCPVARCRRGLRRDPSGSALPRLPQSVSRGARFSRLHWFAFATACQVARPPDRVSPATGGFYIQASGGSVALPAAGYDYNSNWTTLLAGLSPAGMAASLAAPDPSGPSQLSSRTLPNRRPIEPGIVGESEVGTWRRRHPKKPVLIMVNEPFRQVLPRSSPSSSAAHGSRGALPHIRERLRRPA